MAFGVLSTRNGGKLTAQQHASQMKKSGLDFCLLEYGNGFSLNSSNLTLFLGTGMGQCYGRTFMFSDYTSYTVAPNRFFRLIVRVNLATETAFSMIEEYLGAIPGKTHSDNLIDDLFGTHDVEICRGTSSATTLTFTKTISADNSVERYFKSEISNITTNYQTPKITKDDGTTKIAGTETVTKTLTQVVNMCPVGVNTVYINYNSPACPSATEGILYLHKNVANSTTHPNGISTGYFIDIQGKMFILKNAYGTNTPIFEQVTKGSTISFSNNIKNIFPAYPNQMLDIEVSVNTQVGLDKFRVEFYVGNTLVNVTKQGVVATSAGTLNAIVPTTNTFFDITTSSPKLKIYGRLNGALCFNYTSGNIDGRIEYGWLHGVAQFDSIRVVGYSSSGEATMNHTTFVRVDI